jgi:SWIM zinc finger
VKKEKVVHMYTILSNPRPREVCFDVSNGTIKCSCHMFESIGVPCRHILMVLRNEQVNELPPNLILERWTKKSTEKRLLAMMVLFWV